MSHLDHLIKTRRSVFPDVYNGKPIPEELIKKVLENGNWAPNHKMTEPWRFKVLQGDALIKLSEFLTKDYLANTPPEAQSEVKLQKMKKNPLKAAAIIAICMESHEKLLPQWEELAAVACAVQNMWLTCTDNHIGCYWSTPSAIERMENLLQLPNDQTCIGLFYMGYSDIILPPGKRGPIEEKTQWMY